MAVRTKEEIMNKVKTYMGDDTSDDALAFVTDLSDTLDSGSKSTNNDGVDYKAKYEEAEARVKDTDAKWRQRYRDRFFGVIDPNDDKEFGEAGDGEPKKQDDQPEPEKFEDLFKEGE